MYSSQALASWFVLIPSFVFTSFKKFSILSLECLSLNVCLLPDVSVLVEADLLNAWKKKTTKYYNWYSLHLKSQRLVTILETETKNAQTVVCDSLYHALINYAIYFMSAMYLHEKYIILIMKSLLDFIKYTFLYNKFKLSIHSYPNNGMHLLLKSVQKLHS